MRKIYVAGAAAVAVLAVGGVASFYVAQRRATTEIETMFAALRTGGSTATHGAITFDIWSQALRVDDIVVKSTPEPGLDFKIAKLTADALEVSGNDIVSKTIVLSGVEANWKLAQPLDGQQALKLPRVTIKNFRVPKTIAMPPEATDALVRSVALFSATDASSVNAPSVTVSTSLTPPSTGVARAAAAPIAIDYTYSDVALENLHDGRIARAATSKIGIEGKSGFPILSGTIDSIKSADIDIAPMFGLGLGRRTMSDGFVRVQGKTEIGAYTVKTEAGVTVRVDAITGDDFAIDPSKLSYPRIMAMLPVFSAMGPNPTPSQTAKLADVLGTIYEGMRFKTLDVHGVRITDAKTKPALDFGIGRIGMRGFDKGKLAEFAVENAATENAPSPRGASPFRLGRFALLGFDLSALVRKSMSLAQPRRPGQPPQPAEMLVLFSALEGFEVNDLSFPDASTGQTVEVARMKASWGQFVDGLPTTAQFTTKMSTPLNPRDPNMALLQASGFSSLSVAGEAGWVWNESARTLGYKLAFVVDNLGSLSGNLTFANVPREAFSLAPERIATLLPEVQVGGLELTLLDAGLVALAQKAGGGAPLGDLLAGMRPQLINAEQPSANIAAIFDAAGNFVATPGQTLTLKMTPKSSFAVARLLTPGGMAAPGALQVLLEDFTVDAGAAR